MSGGDVHLLACVGGNRNFGDDLILDVWLRWLAENRRDRTILVNGNPGWMLPHVIDRPNAVFNSQIAGLAHQAAQRMRERYGSLEPEVLVEAGRVAAETLLADRMWRARILDRLRSIHVAGGGWLNALFAPLIAPTSALAHLGERLGVPVYGTGLGLTPVVPAAGAMAALFGRFAVVEVRDAESYAWIAALGAGCDSRIGADDTFLAPVRRSEREDEGPALHVTVASDQEGTGFHREILAKLVQLATTHKGHTLVYSVFYPGWDDAFLQELGTLMPGRLRVVAHDELLERGVPYRAGDACVTTRFHAHLLAARCGAHGLYVPTKPGYYDVKHGSVAALGSGWMPLKEHRIGPGSLDALPEPAIDEAGLAAAKLALADRVYG